MLVPDPQPDTLNGVLPVVAKTGLIQARPSPSQLPDLTLAKGPEGDMPHVAHSAPLHGVQPGRAALLNAFALVLAQYVDAEPGQDAHILLAEMVDGDSTALSSFLVSAAFNSPRQIEPSLLREHVGAANTRSLTPTAAVRLSGQVGELPWLVPVLGLHDDRLVLSAPCKSFDTTVVRLMLHQIMAVAREETLALPHPSLMSFSSSRWAEGYVAYDDPLHWFNHWAQTHPEWEAIVIASSHDGMINEAKVESWSYGELDAKANELARLIGQLAQGDGPVGLCMPRTLISTAALVAIFKSGRTYLPMDEQLPAERKQLLAEDSGCSLVLTEDDVLGVDVPCPVLDVSHPRLPLPASDNSSEAQSPSPESGAYVLYTSGSTGKPKGVLVGRRNLCTFVEAYAQVLGRECPATLSLGGSGRYLGLASRAFDVHLSQTFMAWRFGMALVTGYRPLLLGDLKATAQMLNISHLSCVPSLLDQAALDPREAPSLVFIGVGGEKLTERVRDTLTALPVLNAYGPTETTIMCTSARVHRASHTRDIGPVLPGNTALVCDFDDATAQPVLRGHAGELCIVGDLVAQGYLNRDPALPSGFLTLPDGRRLYRTGDAARMLPDGRLHYLGRRDEQAKIRGQRLEPGEVSQCAMNGTGGKVNASTLIVKHDRLSTPLLFTLLADRAAAPTADLPRLLDLQSNLGQLACQAKRYCQDHLPAYMVPDLVLPVSHLTLLAISGKTDARRLSAWVRQLPLEDLFALDAEPAAARGLNEQERQVVEIALEILPSPLSVGPETSIFELGFDSLAIIRLARALRESGRPVPLTRLRTHPLIREIAEADTAGTDSEAGVRALQAFQTQHGSAARAILGDAYETVLPCLPLQEGMVSLSLISSEHTEHAVYLGSFTVRFPSVPLDGDRVRRAAAQLAQRHAILRTSFAHVDHTTIAQLVSKQIDPSVHVVEAPNEVDAQAILISIADVSPWRFVLHDDKITILLHHALYDAHALPLLLDDLAALLALKPLDPSHHDLSDLIKHIAAVDQVQAEAFWQESLQGTDLSSSPWDGAAALPVLQRVRSEVPLAPLVQAAARAQVTVSSLVTAAVAAAFAPALGTADVVLGQVIWGRSLDLPEAEKIVAPCLTTVPLALPRIATDNFLDMARAAHTEGSAQLRYQHTPLRSIRRWVAAERNSLTDVLVSYLQALGSKADRAWAVDSDSIEEETDAPAAVEAVAEGNALRLSAVIKRALPLGSLEDVVERIKLLLIQSSAGETVALDFFPSVGSRAKQRTSVDEIEAGRVLTPAEQAIKDTAAALAQVDPNLITLTTPFLRIGIDSIVALRFAAQLRREHGLAASAHDVLSTGNITALAQHLAEKQAPVGTDADKPPPPTYLCTPLQAGMLSGTLASASHDLYVHHHIVRLNSGVEEAKLAKALAALVSARDILRTRFRLGDVWEAEVLPAGPQLQHISMSVKMVYHSLTFEEPDQFALPPWRAQVVEDEEECALYLVLSMHHALYDGVSLPALFGDLRALYLGQAVPARPPFSLVATHIQQQAHVAVDHWTRTLDGLTAPSVVPSSVGAYTVKERRLAMSLDHIKSLVHSLQVSLQAITQLAWAKVLAETLGHRDVCFGQVVAGRFLAIPGVQVEDTSGPLINTVPIRTTVEPLSSNFEALQHVHQQALTGQAYDYAPLSAVLAKWRSETGIPTLFNTLLVFHNATEARPNANKELWYSPPLQVESAEAASEYPINVSIVLDLDGLRIRIGAPEGCMSDAADKLVLTLEDLLSRPHRPAGAYPEGLAQLPSHPAETEMDESPYADRVGLTDHERAIVLAALSAKLQVSEATVASCHNLFLLGLDSLLAIAVAAQARDNGLLIAPHDLLAARTVDRITRAAPVPTPSYVGEGALVAEIQRATALEVLGLEEDEVEAVLPTLPRQALTLDQFVLWQRRFLEATFLWETSVQLDPSNVDRAWRMLRDRHQVLRSDFVRTSDGKVVQVVLQPGVWHLPIKHVVVPEGADLKETAFATLKELNATPSDFFFSTPGRLTHLSSTDGDVIMFTAHHAQYDPPTIRMLARELSALLTEDDTLPPPAQWTEYVDYALRANHAKAVEAYNALLSQAEATVFCRSSPSPQDAQVLVRRVLLDDAEPLESYARTLGLGLSHFVTLAVGRAIAAYTSTTHPTLHFLASGRACSFEGLDRLAGFTTISRPLSFNVEEKRQALETIQQALIAHAGLGQAAIQSPVRADVTLNLLLPHGSGPVRQAQELLRPLSLGRDSGFYTVQPPMPGRTAIDWPQGQEPGADGAVVIDVALRGKCLSAGIVCNDPSIGADELEGVLNSIASELLDLATAGPGA